MWSVELPTPSQLRSKRKKQQLFDDELQILDACHIQTSPKEDYPKNLEQVQEAETCDDDELQILYACDFQTWAKEDHSKNLEHLQEAATCYDDELQILGACNIQTRAKEHSKNFMQLQEAATCDDDELQILDACDIQTWAKDDRSNNFEQEAITTYSESNELINITSCSNREYKSWAANGIQRPQQPLIPQPHLQPHSVQYNNESNQYFGETSSDEQQDCYTKKGRKTTTTPPPHNNQYSIYSGLEPWQLGNVITNTSCSDQEYQNWAAKGMQLPWQPHLQPHPVQHNKRRLNFEETLSDEQQDCYTKKMRTTPNTSPPTNNQCSIFSGLEPWESELMNKEIHKPNALPESNAAVRGLCFDANFNLVPIQSQNLSLWT